MAHPVPPLTLLWVAAFSFIVSAVYLGYRLRKKNLKELYPIIHYLLAIGAHFIFLGFFEIVPNNLLVLFASFSVIVGSSSISRIPIKLQFPRKEKPVFSLLLFFSFLFTTYMFTLDNPTTQMWVANIFAFLTAGLFTIGFIIYSGIRSRNRVVKIKSVGVGVSLGLCCVIAHGLVSFKLLTTFSFTLLGIFSVTVPLLFAILSPITLVFVLVLTKLIEEGKSYEDYEKPK